LFAYLSVVCSHTFPLTRAPPVAESQPAKLAHFFELETGCVFSISFT
jgi:hypothetical protein